MKPQQVTLRQSITKDKYHNFVEINFCHNYKSKKLSLT